MSSNGIASSGDLWQSIRRDAERALARDPIFGSFLSAAILDQSDLGSALSWQVGERVGKTIAERRRFADVAREAFQASPDLVEAASRDLQAIAVHDPAITGLLPPLLNFKGYVALQAWRVSNWLWRQNRIDLAQLLQSESSDSLQVSIHPSASIGTSVFLDHATGIIVSSFVVIGDEVTILQNVTVGRKDGLPGPAPRIGRGVYIGSEATILGDISIGDFARIGAGSVVTSDVPAGCTAVGVPARLTNCPEQRIPA
jgi:serine O-acetyltransferase